MKVSRRYYLELHKFCASRCLGPEVLGFESLTRGWFAVVMEKVSTRDVTKIKNFRRLEVWKREIESLVGSSIKRGGRMAICDWPFSSPRKKRARGR